jgi:RNA polymerase sigma factor (sigma-70 family)
LRRENGYNPRQFGGDGAFTTVQKICNRAMKDHHRHFQLLLDQVREGSHEAARILEERYGAHILRIVRRKLQKSARTRFDSIDIVQNVWASVFTKPYNLPDVETPEDLATWLGTLASNKATDEGRQLQTQKRDISREIRIDEHAAIAGPHPISRDPTPSAVAVYHEQLERLVVKQPPKVRRIVELKMQGLTYDEIAAALGLDERTARRVIKRLEEQTAHSAPAEPDDRPQREG